MVNYNKTEKYNQGESYQLARLLLEYGLVPDDLKRDRKLLKEIHGWIRAMFPIEKDLPAGCTETLPELIELNRKELDQTVELTVFDECQIQLLSVEEKVWYRQVLDEVSDRSKEIVRRGKLIENQGHREGAPLP